MKNCSYVEILGLYVVGLSSILMFNRNRRNKNEEPTPENEEPTAEIPTPTLEEIWKNAESIRVQVLQKNLAELQEWIVERVSIKLLNDGSVGKFQIGFIEAPKNIQCENVFAPGFLRFDSIEQVFVSSCGIQFEQDEILKPIAQVLSRSGIKMEFQIKANRTRTTPFQISFNAGTNGSSSNKLPKKAIQTMAQKITAKSVKSGSSLKKSVKKGA